MQLITRIIGLLFAGKFPAYVDVDEKFSVTDKLSMVNTLLQMENVTSYPFMRNNK